MENKAKVMTWVQKYTMILILVMVIIFFNIQTNGKILLPQNITNLISQNAYVFVLAVGMLLCILTGGNIDLSVGSVVCFVGAVGALMITSDMNILLVIVFMLGIGLLIGIWQGYWVAFVRVPPFIVTLAGMLVFRGLSNVVLEGKAVSIASYSTFVQMFGGGANCYIPDIFGFEGINITAIIIGIIITACYIAYEAKVMSKQRATGQNVFMQKVILKVVGATAIIMFFAIQFSQYKGVPTALIWVALIVAIYGYITSKTTIGRHFYAVGGNEKATRLSGINTSKVYFIAYANMGLLSALAGMLTIARMTSAQPTYGTNYEMDAISACFIGGASAYGGVGTVPGVIIGALLMGIINLGMSISGVDSNYQKVVKGLVLLAAVIFDIVSKRKKA
ncbi:ABC transporter permease [Candidatus Epulonipiscioides gigas]|nr:ABC transporter permease [Epulopiscium sp. SCG-C07WGA-EpuloA2]ONI44838.1 ABC transporter permease [Epulopiscium sp. SCG-C07WGA-EpuloA2]